MIKNGDMPANPCKVTLDRDRKEIKPYQFGSDDFIEVGLTKREQFAMAALQGILSSKYYADFCDKSRKIYKTDAAAERAIKHADSLLALLEKHND